MHDAEYITLHQAAKLVPGGTSANCIWRWCRKGMLSRAGNRVRLRHVRIGGEIYTSAEWLHEFGPEAAQVLLGHGKADVAQAYAERDMAWAASIAAEIG